MCDWVTAISKALDAASGEHVKFELRSVVEHCLLLLSFEKVVELVLEPTKIKAVAARNGDICDQIS
jgi:hypothetical protein